MRLHTLSRRLSLILLSSFLIALAGCHNVIIDSGLEPSTTVHQKQWNMAFAWAIFPAQVDASGYCGGMWARVETRQSFLNLVVEAVTSGIISPLESKVVCARQTGSAEEDASAPEPSPEGDL